MGKKSAMLFLEDGTCFDGEFFSDQQDAVGQVMFNTAVVGYQEIITDPANTGKIIILTYPLIGNYGVNEKFNESEKIWASGLVVKENSKIYSNWQAQGSFTDYVKKGRIASMEGVDTRTIAVKIRKEGEMLGVISSAGTDFKVLAKKIADFKNKSKKSALPEVSVKEITKIKGIPRLRSGREGKRLIVIDLGTQKSVLNQLSDFGFDLTVAPYNITAKDITKLQPNGIIISNGPENDLGLSGVTDTVKELLGKVPMLGISTGHHVIAMALGAKIKKMDLGHHGVNYPVISQKSLKGEITAQNHSFVVDEKTLKNKDVEIVEKNLNDKTIEKLKSKKLKFISIQYYPNSPGMKEINSIFGEFNNLLGGKNG